MKQTILCLFIILLFTGCILDADEYKLVAKGTITRIEIIGGGFANPAKRVFYFDSGSLCVFGLYEYEDVKIGDYVYVYHRDWDGTIITRKPLEKT